MTALDRILLARMDEQMANFKEQIAGTGKRACLPCSVVGCERKIAAYNKTRMCTAHAQKAFVNNKRHAP